MGHNVISIGDSSHEMDATRDVLWSLDGNSLPWCKTIRFATRPTLAQLGQQLQTLKARLEHILNHEGDLALSMASSIVGSDHLECVEDDTDGCPQGSAPRQHASV